MTRRIGAERLDRAENLAAVLCAVLRRYALEPAPRKLRAAEHAADQARVSQPPPPPCAHGDPGGCAACSFCRRGHADPEGERCPRCAPSVPLPKVVSDRRCPVLRECADYASAGDGLASTGDPPP